MDVEGGQMISQGQAHPFYKVGFMYSWIFIWTSVGDTSLLPSPTALMGRGQSFTQLAAGQSSELAGCRAQDQMSLSPSSKMWTAKSWGLVLRLGEWQTQPWKAWMGKLHILCSCVTGQVLAGRQGKLLCSSSLKAAWLNEYNQEKVNRGCTGPQESGLNTPEPPRESH